MVITLREHIHPLSIIQIHGIIAEVKPCSVLTFKKRSFNFIQQTPLGKIFRCWIHCVKENEHVLDFTWSCLADVIHNSPMADHRSMWYELNVMICLTNLIVRRAFHFLGIPPKLIHCPEWPHVAPKNLTHIGSGDSFVRRLQAIARIHEALSSVRSWDIRLGTMLLKMLKTQINKIRLQTTHFIITSNYHRDECVNGDYQCVV